MATIEQLRERAERLEEWRPGDSNPAPGVPGNDVAELMRETLSLLKDLVLYLDRSRDHA